MFNSAEFKSGFEKRVKALAKAESITKETLRDMSRELLFVTQETEDIGYINRTIAALTPMNRKTAILFFKEFSGFNWSDEEGQFKNKNKKKYEEVCSIACNRLDDPHFNLWTWAEANLSVEPKAFKLEDVTKFAKNAIKKAKDSGVEQSALLEAFIAGGFTPESILVLMEKMTDKA